MRSRGRKWPWKPWHRSIPSARTRGPPAQATERRRADEDEIAPWPEGTLAVRQPARVPPRSAGILDALRPDVRRLRQAPLRAAPDDVGQSPRPDRGGSGHPESPLHQALRAADVADD